MDMRPSWEGVMFFLESLWHLTFFGMRAMATAVPPEACSCIRLPWDRLVRDLKSVAASWSLMMSNPVTIPIGLPLAMLCLTGEKGVRSVLLESPVARAVTRTMVQASSGISCIEERPQAEDVVSYLLSGQKCIRRCSGVLERMAICNAHKVTCSNGKRSVCVLPPGFICQLKRRIILDCAQFIVPLKRVIFTSMLSNTLCSKSEESRGHRQ